ncbi:MAG: cysteine desulfurase family protein [bacterium]|nr:cysteine desulfurase family protein [bacterium]
MKQIYLDNAASTPVDPRVEAAMWPYFWSAYGNPSALHRPGQKASRAVFESRRTIAGAIGAHYEEIVFTGSATEANNLAIRGLWEGIRRVKKFTKPRLITFSIEHESVLRSCEVLADEGVEVVYIKPERNGTFDLKRFAKSLNGQTFLVSVMHANNETGVIQPIAEIAKIIQEFRSVRSSMLDVGKGEQQAKRSNKPSDPTFQTIPATFPYFHTDAVQSFQYLDCDVKKLGVDLMTLSAHKIYGPKGVGALYVGSSLKENIQPVICGAGQEGGLRSGTENVPAIVGFAKATELAISVRDKESERVSGLRECLWKKLIAGTRPKEIFLNGSSENRLPNNLNIYFLGSNAHELLIKLDLAGIAVSPGAACSARVSKESYVLREMGFSAARASGSLRFSLGRQTTKQEINHAISVIIKILGQ